MDQHLHISRSTALRGWRDDAAGLLIMQQSWSDSMLQLGTVDDTAASPGPFTA
jgi:hypothetical protein